MEAARPRDAERPVQGHTVGGARGERSVAVVLGPRGHSLIRRLALVLAKFSESSPGVCSNAAAACYYRPDEGQGAVTSLVARHPSHRGGPR